MNGIDSVPGSAPEAGEERPLSAREALALVEEQRDRVTQSLQVDVTLILGAWGVAWLVGFGVTYLASGKGLGPAVPGWLAGVVIGVLNAIAVAASSGQVIRRGRGIDGPSRQVMLGYMWAWLLAFAGLFAVNLALIHQGLPPRLAALLWPGSATVVVGVLYLAGGVIFTDRLHYGLGVWMLVTGAASVFAGYPGNFAVLSLAGGGGFLAATALYALSKRTSPA